MASLGHKELEKVQLSKGVICSDPTHQGPQVLEVRGLCCKSVPSVCHRQVNEQIYYGNRKQTETYELTPSLKNVTPYEVIKSNWFQFHFEIWYSKLQYKTSGKIAAILHFQIDFLETKVFILINISLKIVS